MARPLRKSRFLERSGYRQRRLRDVAWVLPVVVTVLFLLPLLWQRDGEGPHGTADAMIFVFLVWTVAIAIAALLSRLIAPEDSPTGGPDRGR